MHKRIATVLAAGGAVALTVSLTAAPSFATTTGTWTVKPGGSITVTGSAQVKDAKTGTVAKCTSLKLTGTLKTGSGLSGSSIGTIKTASFTGCAIGTIPVTVAIGSGSLPWEVNALSYNATSHVTTGSLEDIDLQASTTGCSAALDGTGDNANNGLAKFTYANSTGVLKLTGSGNLHSWDVVGCLGLVNSGDAQQASGTATVTPKQTITSP